MTKPIITLCARRNHGKDTVAGILVERHGFMQVAFADPLKWLSTRLFGIDNEAHWGASELREQHLAVVLKKQGVELNDSYWLKVHRNLDKHADWINALFYDEKRKVQMCPDAIPSLLVFVRDFQKLSHGPDKFTGKELTVRHILQQLGTDWGRELWPDLWCYHAFITIDNLKNGAGYDRTIGMIPNQGGPTPKGFAISDCRYPDNETRYTLNNGGVLWWIDSSKRIREDFDPRNKEHNSEPCKQDFIDAGLNPLIIDNNGDFDDLRKVVKIEMKKLR